MMATKELPADASRTPADVLNLLKEQCSLYERLHGVASRQRTLITGGDPNSLLSLLADRQKLSAELTTVSAALEPVRRVWDDYRERLTPDQRSEAERLLAGIRGHLRDVIESDEQDAKLLSARKQATGAALRSNHSMAQAMTAYRTQGPEPARLNQLDEAVE